MGRDIDWGNPKQIIAFRHGGRDESRLNFCDGNWQTLLRTLVPQCPQITRHKSLGSPVRGRFPMAADGGYRRDADKMSTTTTGKVLHGHGCHRRETGDIHCDRVSLGFPIQRRIPAPRPGGDDEHIGTTDFRNQVTRSRPGGRDIVQIEPHSGRYSRMLRRDFVESFNTSRCDPDGISASRQLHGDGGTYA